MFIVNSMFTLGGLGGVHRCAEKTFDISADLKELGRNSIAVVAAGIKSILDIGKTLEYLVSPKCLPNVNISVKVEHAFHSFTCQLPTQVNRRTNNVNYSCG